MSRVEEPLICSSPDLMALPTVPVSVARSLPGSSRASSSSSFRIAGFTNGSTDKLPDIQPPPRSSSSQSSLPRSSSDVMPHAEGSVDGSGKSTPDVDSQIVEALKSKDRLFVLKLGEQMEALIREKDHIPRSKFNISPENQYQRLLVHRCAQYYRLLPENDPNPRDKSGARDMIVSMTAEGQIPLRRIFELVPAEQTNHPTFKIMRRSELDRRRQKPSISRPGSTAGEDGELSDPGPSESGSLASRSTTSKKRMTIQEREAAYEAARSRIFMDFEEKEKAKERDTSASSSTLSLASASGSGSQSGGAGGSSISDVDDSASTAPTESEWSVPGTDRRRTGDSGFSSTDSTRSFPSFNTQRGAGERVSGRSSPALTFPSLYEPPAQTQGHDQHGYMPPPMGFAGPSYTMYFPQQVPQNAGQVPSAYPPYPAQYQYFPQYPYAGPPPPQHPPPHTGPSPSSPATGQVEGYPQHSANIAFMPPNGYGWTPPPQNQQPRFPSENQSSPVHGHNAGQAPPVQGTPPIQYPYPTYMPPSVAPYPGYPPYFQPPPQVHPPVPHPHSQPIHPIELPPTKGNGSDRGTPSGPSSGKGSPSPTLSRHTSSSGSSSGYPNHLNGNGGNRRGMPPSRGVWNYSPGPVIRPSVSGLGLQGSPGGGDTVGPRLSSAMRRTSGASSNSSGYRTPGDETASVASSSTSSSSSRRTYNTSTSTPPIHPLPARPDWAAGMKAQPTLHPPVRHRHDSNNNSRTMSPARPPQQLQNNHQPSPQQRPPIHLQPADFPPLSNVPSGKRPPPGSAWSNTSPAARAVLSPNPGHLNQSHGNTYGSALFNHSNTNRLEDDERGFERPPPKSNAELYNPKGGAKRTSQSQSPQQNPEPGNAPVNVVGTAGNILDRHHEPRDQSASGILIDTMGSLRIQAQHAESEIENTPRADSVLSGLSQEPKAENAAS